MYVGERVLTQRALEGDLGVELLSLPLSLLCATDKATNYAQTLVAIREYVRQQNQVGSRTCPEKTLLMEIPEQLRCLFSATVDERDGSYIIEVPKQEIQRGSLETGETYRAAILPSPSTEKSDKTDQYQEREDETLKPPVEEGEQRTVEIEDLGDQGDGLTRVERGFVVIVPDTEQSERVTVEITDVRENVAFADVIKRLDYYE